jgi:hypothetical protein
LEEDEEMEGVDEEQVEEGGELGAQQQEGGGEG